MSITTNNIEAFLESTLEIAELAGQAILEVYDQELEVVEKADKSPLTEADRRSHTIISDRLSAITSEIPILSEESREVPYEVRQRWETFWLVDPLDGTKEFIKRNGEFTVNIALIQQNRPILGVVLIPVTGRVFYGIENQGAFVREADGSTRRLAANPVPKSGTITIAGSRSHSSEAMERYVNEKKQQYDSVNFISAGSSLKFCLVAEGKADIYPRLAPTMEWDTAAAHVIARESGKRVTCYETGEELTYNKPDLLNPNFICS